MAAERCSAWAEEMTASLAVSGGMATLKTGSSVSGKIDLGREEGKIGEEEFSSTKSGVPPNSTSSDGGNGFPLHHQKTQQRRLETEGKRREEDQGRKLFREKGKEWLPVWNSLSENQEELQEWDGLLEAGRPLPAQGCGR